MQVTKHQEHQDADNQRSETQIEFTFDESDKENIDLTFELTNFNDMVNYTAICQDGDVYTMLVDKDYNVAEYTK